MTISDRKIRTCVFPVAGLGTRMLPATKSLPKEMLPVVDKPIVQYALEEAAAAGIEKFVFVTGRGKALIEDHFDRAYELFETLVQKGKTEALARLEADVPGAGEVIYTRQQQPLGLGHAVWCARNLVGEQSFAVSLVDDLIIGKSCIAELVEAHQSTGGNIVAVMDVPRPDTSKYGIIDPGSIDGNLTEIHGLVEKPTADQAPSTMAIVGRYILSSDIFKLLGHHETGAGGEIQLTDAMKRLIGEQPFHGLTFSGQRFDCGDKLGYLDAVIAVALKHPELAAGMRTIVSRAASMDH